MWPKFIQNGLLRKVTIKETAGKILLYLYQLQRTAPLAMPRHQVGFINRKDKGLGITSDKKWLSKDLVGINSETTDTLNALNYLISKKYISSSERATPDAKVYVGLQLTDIGLDIVEGIERDSEGKDDFYRTFNIAVDDDTDIDKLSKDNLRMLSD